MMQPEPGSLVLGGQRQPEPGSLVLGGHGLRLGKLFERFNLEARPCAIHYFRLQLTEHVALVRPKKSGPYDNIKVKYRFLLSEIIESDEIKDRIYSADNFYTSINNGFWDFAGYLKHNGVLFGCQGQWLPAGCLKSIRPKVFQTLIEVSSR